MIRACLVSVLIASLNTPITVSGDDLSVQEMSIDELWTKWKTGDEEAYRRLLELGPETRELARRLLKPEGEVFHKWPETSEEIELLAAMRADAVPELIDAIRSGIGDERIKFLSHLESLGRMARPAGEGVLGIALEEDDADRVAALRVLASAQTKKDFLIPEAIRLLSTSGLSSAHLTPMSGPDQFAAVGAELLSFSGGERAEAALVRAIRFHTASQVREIAIETLVHIAPDENWLVRYVLIDKLNDNAATFSGFGGSGGVSRTAMNSILQYPELPADAAVGLIEKLYRESYEESFLDLELLCESICRCPTTDVHAAELVKRKLRPLLDEDAYFHEVDAQLFRVVAASVVLKWDPTDEMPAKFLADVANEISDRDFRAEMGGRWPDVRAQAADGLARIGPAAKQWLPMLHQVMDREINANPNSELAFSAAWAIAQIDHADTKCLSVLRDASEEFLLMQRIPWTRIETVLGNRAESLVQIDEVLAELKDAQFLLDQPPDRSEYEEWAWMVLRPHREQVVPVLVEHLKSEDIDVRIAAARILAYIDVSPDVVVPAIADLLDDRYASVRAVAAETLALFGQDATAAIQALERAAQDEYLTVKLAAQDAMSAIRQIPLE